MSDSPRSGSPVEGSILVSDTDESGQTIETRRRLSSLVNKETARAFGEVSKALGLNLSELVVENPREKKLIAMNFNRWLSRSETRGNFQLQNLEFTTIPPFITGLRYDCTSLDLQFNQFTNLSDSVCKLTRLNHLNVSHNLLGTVDPLNCLPSGLEALSRLSRISLGDNQLTEIPDVILSLPQLRWLELQDNGINIFPEKLTLLSNLLVLDLRYNDLPYIPESISKLNSLTTLLLDGNILIEPLPESLFTITTLTHLSLQSMCLESFPVEVCQLTGLKHLNLAHNSIKSIPEEISSLIFLETFNIGGNRITSLPETFGWLISLNDFKWFGLMNKLNNVPENCRNSVAKTRNHFRKGYRKIMDQRIALFDEPDCMNNVRWKRYKGLYHNDNLLQGATIEKYICLMTHEQYHNADLTRSLLHLHKSFCSSQELLELLIQRYKTNNKKENSEDATTERTIACRTAKTVSLWMETHPAHFNTEMEQALLEFIASADSTDSPLLKKAFTFLTTVESQEPSSPRVSKPPKPIIPSSSNFSITNLDPKELARQCCLMEYELFHQIDIEEFMNQNWTRNNKAEVAPKLTQFIQQFNRFSSIVSSSIVKFKDTKQRVQVLTLFLLVAEECRLLNNYNTVIEIVATLHSSPIARLNITWKLLSNKLKTIWENLQVLTAMDNNYKAYRAALKDSCSSPTIPNIGVILKDLTFLNDGNTDYLGDNDELHNFSKLKQFEDIMSQIETWQKLPYNFEAVPQIQSVIKSTEILDEKQAYNESLICEDRQGRTPAMRGEIVASPNNTVINLDLNLTKEQLELAEKCHHEWKDTQLQLGLTTGNEVTKSGYLLLREDSSWKRMWFTMQFPSLYYYAKQTDKRPTGVIALLGVTVEKIGKKKNIAILISGKKSRAYALRGDDDKVSMSWFEDLCKLVNK